MEEKARTWPSFGCGLVCLLEDSDDGLECVVVGVLVGVPRNGMTRARVRH